MKEYGTGLNVLTGS